MKALLLIDIQNDFLPGGSLAVEKGHEVIAVANRLMSQFDLIVATQDYHPADHLSFASQHPEHQIGQSIDLDGLQQILWPDHCVDGTLGVQFSPELDADEIHHVVRKGTDRNFDSYSGFFDNARRKATGLDEYLREQGVNELHLVGLATDYCVKFTAMDAIELGYRTVLVSEGVRGVDLAAGDCQRAIDEMRAAGVAIN